MNPFTSTNISLFSTLGICVAILLVSQGTVQAELRANPPSSQIQPPSNIQTHDALKLKLCPDLKVSFTLVKGSNGLVTMQGTVTNVGKGDYDIMSKAEVIMNLSYAPQYSYAMSGVSDVLISTPFTKLKAGASFPVNGTYQIPNFTGWAAGTVEANAKRLFTLRVIKQDMSTYKPGEECNPGDNFKSAELAYHETKH